MLDLVSDIFQFPIDKRFRHFSSAKDSFLVFFFPS